MTRNLWHIGTRYEKMIDDLYIRGVTVQYFKDKHRPTDDSIPVFNREMFMHKLGLKYKVNNPSQTYIELADALTIYNQQN